MRKLVWTWHLPGTLKLTALVQGYVSSASNTSSLSNADLPRSATPLKRKPLALHFGIPELHLLLCSCKSRPHSFTQPSAVEIANCWLSSGRGAVKSNVGHLEGASGIAGIIKAILVLESAVIPPNANFEKLNPNIDADGLRITVRRSRLSSLPILTDLTVPSK